MSGGNKFVRGFANGWWMGDITSWRNRVLNFADDQQLALLGSKHEPALPTSDGSPQYRDIDGPPGATGPEGGTNTTASGSNPGVTFIPFNRATVITGNPNQWFNPLMFVPGPTGYLGNASREILPGPHLANVRHVQSKDTAAPFLGEAGKIQFRAEFFNIFNHANFALPGSGATNYIYAGNPADGSYAEAPLIPAGKY